MLKSKLKSKVLKALMVGVLTVAVVVPIIPAMSTLASSENVVCENRENCNEPGKGSGRDGKVGRQGKGINGKKDGSGTGRRNRDRSRNASCPSNPSLSK